MVCKLGGACTQGVTGVKQEDFTWTMQIQVWWQCGTCGSLAKVSDHSKDSLCLSQACTPEICSRNTTPQAGACCPPQRVSPEVSGGDLLIAVECPSC